MTMDPLSKKIITILATNTVISMLAITYVLICITQCRKINMNLSKDKLRKIKMEKGDTIPKYLTKFFQCRDELGSVGITVVDDDLVSLVLLGLPKSWHSYQDSVNGREKLPNWE
jgi:hypothetical protein